MQQRHSNSTNPFHKPSPAEGRKLVKQNIVQEMKNKQQTDDSRPIRKAGCCIKWATEQKSVAGLNS